MLRVYLKAVALGRPHRAQISDVCNVIVSVSSFAVYVFELALVVYFKRDGMIELIKLYGTVSRDYGDYLRSR